jgi:hypothetical protein
MKHYVTQECCLYKYNLIDYVPFLIEFFLLIYIYPENYLQLLIIIGLLPYVNALFNRFRESRNSKEISSNQLNRGNGNFLQKLSSGIRLQA